MIVNAVLRRFPRLKVWFKRLHKETLSPRARKIYADLKSAMARQQQGSN